jgi:hypothetical protein
MPPAYGIYLKSMSMISSASSSPRCRNSYGMLQMRFWRGSTTYSPQTMMTIMTQSHGRSYSRTKGDTHFSRHSSALNLMGMQRQCGSKLQIVRSYSQHCNLGFVMHQGAPAASLSNNLRQLWQNSGMRPLQSLLAWDSCPHVIESWRKSPIPSGYYGTNICWQTSGAAAHSFESQQRTQLGVGSSYQDGWTMWA